MTHTHHIELPQIKVACESCSLRKLCLPYGLDSSDMNQLDDIIKRPKAIEKNAYLFQAGQAFTAISVVRSGSIKTFTVANSGEQQVTGFHLPGEIVGFDGVSEDIHQCSAMALETTSVCQLPFDGLEQIMADVPGLQRQLHRIMSRELVEEQQLLLQIGKMTAEQRLAAFLINFALRLKQRGFSPNEFNFSMSRSDIANYLGLAVETVSRQFTQFQNDGYIKTDRKFIQILNFPALNKLSGMLSCQ